MANVSESSLELGHEFSGFCVVSQRAQNRRDGESMDTITPVPQSIESLLLLFALLYSGTPSVPRGVKREARLVSSFAKYVLNSKLPPSLGVNASGRQAFLSGCQSLLR